MHFSAGIHANVVLGPRTACPFLRTTERPKKSSPNEAYKG